MKIFDTRISRTVVNYTFYRVHVADTDTAHNTHGGLFYKLGDS